MKQQQHDINLRRTRKKKKSESQVGFEPTTLRDLVGNSGPENFIPESSSPFAEISVNHQKQLWEPETSIKDGFYRVKHTTPSSSGMQRQTIDVFNINLGG